MSEPTRTIGQLAQLACEWEVLARKAGNVCPGREFPDLTVDDFLRSAAAIAPVMEEAPHQALGVTILRSIEATRAVVNTNTNLGIVLLLAPLASVPLDEPLMPALSRVLAQTTVEDARNAYQAIRLAKPGGLGSTDTQDVAVDPTLPLRDVMALAKGRDFVAEQYASDFGVVRWLADQLIDAVHLLSGNIEDAIVTVQLLALSFFDDSLIARKLGAEAARDIGRRANPILNESDDRRRRTLFLEFDAYLRSDGHKRNPGTTADLIAAALFIALREQKISLDTPFTWCEHPFEIDV
jgi:triphosphoribosyl-dephospho-CoA synthase